jgi:protein ImuB
MDRLVCVDITLFALQLALRQAPGDVDAPWAVVTREEATGEVEHANRKAWARGVRPGMRVAAAMALCGQLRTAVVDAKTLSDASFGLVTLLHTFSPHVEIHPGRPGTFWVDGQGIERLFGGTETWSARLSLALQQHGWRAVIVAGFSRFATASLAITQSGVNVPILFAHPAQEAQALGRVPLEKLDLPLADRELLRDLGVETIGQLCAWRQGDVHRRFGDGPVLVLWRQACGQDTLPVQNVEEPTTVEAGEDVDLRRPDAAQLLWWAEQKLPSLVEQLNTRGEHLAEVTLSLQLDDRSNVDTSIRCAKPTSDIPTIVELIRLRIESLPLRRGIIHVRISASGQPWKSEQPTLFVSLNRRDMDAGARALARIAAEFGAESVGFWNHSDGHLPEAQARFQHSTALRLPVPHTTHAPMLVRRVYGAPRPLQHRTPTHEPDGWLVAGLDAGPVIHSAGPHVVSGGWWARHVHREYYYTETRRGDLLWIFYDRRRRTWFQHGEVT